MRLYESEYLTVNYLEVQYLFHFKFKKKTYNIDINTVKAEFFLFFDKMVKRKARYVMFDCENMEHIFDNEFISWYNKTIFPLIKSVKAEKIAWYIRKNINFEISLSFLTSDKKEIKQKIFNKPDLAMKWLLEGAKQKKLSFQDGNIPKHHHHH